MRFLVAFACCAWTIGPALAAPAVPLYVPPPSIESAPFDFRDTQWIGITYEGKEWIVVFHADGRVSNTDNGSKHPFSGTWKATGNSMYMELHAKYYEFRGILAGNILAGDSANTAGLRWKTSFRRAGFAK